MERISATFCNSIQDTEQWLHPSKIGICMLFHSQVTAWRCLCCNRGCRSNCKHIQELAVRRPFKNGAYRCHCRMACCKAVLTSGKSRKTIGDMRDPLSSVVEVKRESHAYKIKIPPGISFFSNIWALIQQANSRASCYAMESWEVNQISSNLPKNEPWHGV